ncbi:MAG TPA: hypothetical protein DCZ69_13795, partial [Syntrophobacteraceae bacterium]|nr:hypothetical protein [Syntrophobacteraceae bacterium]
GGGAWRRSWTAMAGGWTELWAFRRVFRNRSGSWGSCGLILSGALWLVGPHRLAGEGVPLKGPPGRGGHSHQDAKRDQDQKQPRGTWMDPWPRTHL